MDDVYATILRRYIEDDTQTRRYRNAVAMLAPLVPYLRGQVLDFGASRGLSMLALAEIGVSDTTGIEPNAIRVATGKRILAAAGMNPDRLAHVADTGHLPFAAEAFDAVLALAVFEHIPQPRAKYIREVWRVLRPGGYLLIAETPNKYYPVEVHTTGLPLIHWLPSRLAHRIALRFGRNREWYATREKWACSGWRGMGFHELTAALDGPWQWLHDDTRPRHRRLRALGFFPGLIDPYPVYVLQKS